MSEEKLIPYHLRPENREKKRIYDARHHKKSNRFENSKRYREKNKEKIKEKKKIYFQKNKEKVREGWHKNVLRWRFGITFEQYNKMLADQGGVCKICGEFKLSKNTRRMAVDHCHTSNKIRGILCDDCNVGIARFKDDAKRLESAINYLKLNGDDIDIGEIIDINIFSQKSKGKKNVNRFISNRCYASFVNLDHRKDRHTHILSELNKASIHAYRTRGILPSEVGGDLAKYQTMLMRTPGALGCHLSQVEIMKEALLRRKNAFVMEDDLIFCSDIQYRFDYIQSFLEKNDWDVFWLGGTFHVNPPYWHTGSNPLLPDSNLGRDAELTNDPRIIRTYGAFSTHAYIVNYNSIEKILKLFDDHIHTSIGIDFLFIKIQPQLKAYSFVPGCCIQMDNMSDIGKGMTIYSGFSALGPHWYQDKALDFDPLTYNWGEAKIN